MITGNTVPKIKLSISVDASLMDFVDQQALRDQSTRSATIERWLRQAARQTKLVRLEEETATYYAALSPTESSEDAALAAASSLAAARIRIDDDASPASVRSKRRPRKGRRE